jgi:hypothetical protein
MRTKKEQGIPISVIVGGEECFAIADAARIKKVKKTALYHFHNTDRGERSPTLVFKEAGGIIWVTFRSLQAWTPKPYRHYRPQNLREQKPKIKE